MADGGDEAAGVDFEEGLGLVVEVGDFDVLVFESFEFEGYPDALDERAVSGN